MRNEHLITARKQVGKTQLQVATDLGVAESVYQRYEHGTRTPNITTAIKIADILGVKDLRELWQPLNPFKSA